MNTDFMTGVDLYLKMSGPRRDREKEEWMRGFQERQFGLQKERFGLEQQRMDQSMQLSQMEMQELQRKTQQEKERRQALQNLFPTKKIGEGEEAFQERDIPAPGGEARYIRGKGFEYFQQYPTDIQGAMDFQKLAAEFEPQVSKQYKPEMFSTSTGDIQWIEPGQPVPRGMRPYEKPSGTERVSQNYMLPNKEVVMSYDGGRTYVGRDNRTYPMPPNSLKVTPTATLDELRMQEAKQQAVGGIAQPPSAPTAGMTTAEAARKGTGPWATLAATIDNVAGGIGVDKIFGAQGIFPETQEARQVLRLLKQSGKAALLNSARGAIWEQQKIDELFPDPDKLWRNPATEGQKLIKMRELLTTEREYNDQAILRAVIPSEIKRLRESNDEIDRLLVLIGRSEPGSYRMSSEDDVLINKYLIR